MALNGRSARTDLALEARETAAASENGEIPGVSLTERESEGFPVTEVLILDARGEQKLGKPIGKYITVALDRYIAREEGAFEDASRVLSEELRRLLRLRGNESILVAGLGNDAITPDAVGPRTARRILATRHLVSAVPEHFGDLRSVSVLESGVLARTGMESAEVIRAVCEKLMPDRVIAVDALCSGSPERLCRTVQLTDSGIVPGSGVGNRRKALNEKTLGVPVVAVGVPTVTDALTLCRALSPETEFLQDRPESAMIVTPREIDAGVEDCAKLAAMAINLALQDTLTGADVTMLLS